MERLSRTLQTTLFSLLGSCFTPVWAGAEHCSDVPVQVHSAHPVEMEDLCQGAASALRFLEAYGVKPIRIIDIDIVDSVSEHYGNKALGSYDVDKGRILLMSMQEMTDTRAVSTLYGQAFDRLHYRSVVAHEVAHALFHQNSPKARLTNAAQEYLAYVTQLAVLPAERRQLIIEHAGVSAWESGDSISEVYMAMAPEQFAVKSYLHFSGMTDPAAFVRVLLNVKWFYVYVP
ncbi:hypothetical protein KQ940_15480 [Marinobacterium sp. D7]|uniref:DUF6639 family protein n=1 Tax=Marinobacterium ramblicola TaxID=2849041 RepID=UPI001C2DE3CF|nr:DUF6639 family protein [Marinobacterium ramblicola]MBV1789455.1 hypothetical protein [Marinobacterium ramblicola]